MKILNIHGLNGSHNNTNFKILKDMFPEADIVSPQIDYVNVSPKIIISSIVSTLDDVDLIVGNSFGGFFAYIIGSMKGAKTLLVNPCIPPDKYIPNLVNGYEYRKILSDLWAEYADTNCDYSVILGNADKVLDINTTLNYLKPSDSRLAIIEGGHSLKGEVFENTFKEMLK